MCENVKDLLYKPIKQDSRNMAELGNKMGWDWLEQEGNKNTKNPGRAAGKAAGYAATWYLGGLAGAGAGAAGAAGTTAAETAGTIAAEEAAKQAALQALQQGGQQGLLQGVEGYAPASLMEAAKSSPALKGSLLDAGKQALASGAYNAMVPGVGSQQAAMLAEQTGPFGLQGLAKTMESAGGANGLNSMQQLGAKAGGLLGKMGNNPQSAKLAMQMGKNMMPQQQPGPRPMPPPQQGQQGPLPMPYQNNAIGSPMGGPPPGMTMEEWLKRKQMGLLGGM